MDRNPVLITMGLKASIAIYVSAALLMLLQTRFLIPFLGKITGQEIILFWFIVGGLGIFTSLIITGLVILRSEGYRLERATLTGRLRFRKITFKDLAWCMGGLVAVAILSGLILKGLELLTGGFDHSPAFMSFEPLTPGRYWLLIVWLPYWVLNIFGEEFFWRGVMLPRQEVAFGKNAWIIHGFGWGLFHVAFGWQLLLTLIPLIFIQSFVVQKTKNSWIGVLMHGGLNGPSFIAISFGWI
jgi:membrane protease YdiL (CAAX protease family)